MKCYLQYHNCDKLGWVPLDPEPFLATEMGAYTSRREALEATGGRVLLIVSVGKPGRCFLWEMFTVENIEPEGKDYLLSGPGWQLMPPQRLEGEAFDEFRRACANFRSFRSVAHLPYTEELVRLAERHRQTELSADVERFCTELLELRPNDGDLSYARGFVRRRLGLPGAEDDLERAAKRGKERREQAAALLREVRAGGA
jgi:hypothetical protein